MPRAPKPKPERWTLHMIVEKNGWLRPQTDLDAERIARYRVGDSLKITEPHVPKNEAQQRLYRAGIAIIARAKGIHPDVLHDRIKLATGRVVGVNVWRSMGVEHTSFRALSVAEMDDEAFRAYFNDADQYCREHFDVSFDDAFDIEPDILKKRVNAR